MTVVYIDEVFLLNACVDYLLLLCAAKLAAEPLHRLRMALAAALGGLYAAAVFLPGFDFFTAPLWKLAAAAAMTGIAFAGSRRLLRVSLVFFGVAAAFGGGVLALQLFWGAPAVLDLRTVLLSAAGCYMFFTLIFRRSARHAGRELTSAELTLAGRKCRLTALIDTGNTLTDPITGRPVMVAEADRMTDLFPAGTAPVPAELRDPVQAIEKRQTDPYRWRLLPYQAVGIEHALLLAVRVDEATIGGENYGPILVALAPGRLSDGGGYNALIGA